MKTLPKFIPILVVAVIGLAGLALLTSAWGDPSHGMMPRPWHHGQMEGCDAPHGPGFRHGWHGRPGPDNIATKLSALETEIGIRANQLDSWRDFTDSLQATMMRPVRPMASGADDEKSQPFDLAEHFADNAIARAKGAEELKQAISTLKTTLTPEQLDKVKMIEARFRSHHHWPGPAFNSPAPNQGDKPGADAPNGSDDAPQPSEQ
jgi:hypothetical protein